MRLISLSLRQKIWGQVALKGTNAKFMYTFAVNAELSEIQLPKVYKNIITVNLDWKKSLLRSHPESSLDSKRCRLCQFADRWTGKGKVFPKGWSIPSVGTQSERSIAEALLDLVTAIIFCPNRSGGEGWKKGSGKLHHLCVQKKGSGPAGLMFGASWLMFQLCKVPWYSNMAS